MEICTSFSANVHGLRQKLQVHFTFHSADDQLHAALPGGDICNRRRTHVSVRLYLHTPACDTSEERYHREEKGNMSSRLQLAIRPFSTPVGKNAESAIS